MRLATITIGSRTGLASISGADMRAVFEGDDEWRGDLLHLLREGDAAVKAAGASLARAAVVDATTVRFLPVLPKPGKIICVGLNYSDHAAESGFSPPAYPAFFARFSSSLVGHLQPIVRPSMSDTLDYEGEIAAIIGKGGRYIARAQALSHIAGYTLFNDASVREYQHRTQQWTIGKNFDRTGSFGPAFVSEDELPQGAHGLRLQTRLNGNVVQSASTDDLIFDVASLVSLISEALTLTPGDVIVTGTPSGVGHARNPRLYMRPGDTVDISVEGIGELVNRIEAEPLASMTY